MANFTRADKRAADEPRPVRLTPNFVPTAEGSVLIEVGATRVICTASVEEGVPLFQKGTGRGWVTGEYSMLPRATGRRTPRDSSRGRVAGRSQEIQRLIGRSLRAVTRLDALGERTFILDCDVIQADGGTRAAAITGAYVALALACQKLVEMRILRALPLTDSVAATSVGLVDGAPLLDLTYEEDSRAQVDMNVVMTGGGRLVEVQATAEGATFSEDDFQRLLQLARGGLRRLLDKQQEVVPLNLARP